MNPDWLLKHFDQISEAPDAIPRLRRFILDLAVRGELVEQNPEDEPASELLKRIEEEKARLVKAGEIRKEKPLPPIDENGTLFDLPTSWEWVPIRKVTVDRGQIIPRKDFSYVDVSAIDKERGLIASTQVLTPDLAPSRARKIVRKGDVIYSCVRPYLLNIAVIEEEFKPEPIVSTAFAVLNGLGLTAPRYLWIVLRSPFSVSCVEEKMRGQAYPAINDSDFAILPFPLPPIAEQHRIVAKVDELMALCDKLEAAQAKRERRRDRLVAATLHGLNNGDDRSEPGGRPSFEESARFCFNHLPRLTTRPEHIHQLRQTILNLAVRGKLAKQDPSEGFGSDLLEVVRKLKGQLMEERRLRGEKDVEYSHPTEVSGIPPTWTWACVDDVAIVQGGKRLPKCASFSTAPTPHIYIRITDMKNGTIMADDLKFISPETQRTIARYTINQEDLYITIAGTIGQVGRVPAFLDGHNLTENAAKIVFRGLDPEYLRLALSSDQVQQQFRDKTKQMAQPKLALKRILGAKFPLPPLSEQKRIVAKVDELMALCDELEARITKISNIRHQLLEATLHEALKQCSSREVSYEN